MRPRVVFEHDESDRLTLLHGVRRSTNTKIVDADAQSAYLTMCGEMLYSDMRSLTYKRGIPTCVRCTLAIIEEALCL